MNIENTRFGLADEESGYGLVSNIKMISIVPTLLCLMHNVTKVSKKYAAHLTVETNVV